MKKDSKESSVKKKTSKKTNAKKEVIKIAAKKKPSKTPVSIKKVKSKSSTASAKSQAPLKKPVVKKASVKKAAPVAISKKITKKSTPAKVNKTKPVIAKKSAPTVPPKSNKAKIEVAKPIKKKEIATKGKPEEPVLQKGIKKVKELTKKITDKVSPVLKPLKSKAEAIAKPKINTDEPEPDISEIENIDLGELNIKDKPKKSKSKKNSLKKKEEETTEFKRMPLPDLSAINYNNFKKSEKPEPAKIEAQPSVLVKTEVKKADPKKADIKNRIFDKCMFLQTNSVNIAKRAMNDAQESANEEKGSMEEKFDSFRESMHITRDMYARQFQEGMNSLSMLKRINPNLEHNTVILGSVVYTDFQNYFISVSLGEIVVDEEKFITISTSTPLFQALSGKIKGDTFKFRDQIYTIKDVF